MASAAEVMAELESLGTAQTAKTYRRHGASENVFGVSYADFYKLKKRIKTDHALARELWATGNEDARVLAMMIADPAEATDEDLEGWIRDVEHYGLTFPVAQIAAQKADAQERAARWMASEREWTARAGWQIVEALALASNDLPDAYFEPFLGDAERRIHTAQNRVRDAMNGAVIAIGVRNEALRLAATETAKRIGKVHVDHGDTSCKTPDAVPYIEKVWTKRGQRAK